MLVQIHSPAGDGEIVTVEVEEGATLSEALNKAIESGARLEKSCIFQSSTRQLSLSDRLTQGDRAIVASPSKVAGAGSR